VASVEDLPRRAGAVLSVKSDGDESDVVVECSFDQSFDEAIAELIERSIG